MTVNRGSLWDLGGFAEGFDTNALGGNPPLTLIGGGSVATGNNGIVYCPSAAM